MYNRGATKNQVMLTETRNDWSYYRKGEGSEEVNDENEEKQEEKKEEEEEEEKNAFRPQAERTM